MKHYGKSFKISAIRLKSSNSLVLTLQIAITKKSNKGKQYNIETSMQKKEIEKVISKYRKKAGSTFDFEKAHQYTNIADYIEDNLKNFEEDDYFESEEELLDAYHQVELEIDDQWYNIFSEEDEYDTISDYLTR